MLQEIARHSAHGVSFAFETTLAGLRYARMIDAWRADGYTVKLIFLALGSAEEAIARVAIRVLQGGHDIPEATIRRRFDAGRAHFDSIYRSRVDVWVLFDNSGEIPLLLKGGENR
jgi:predicted ABC-type ATPase